MFRRTQAGHKTDRMLRVEARVGCSLEEDYRHYYLEKGWGQKRLADRWGVKRNTVFESNTRSRRRCWVEMLNLPTRRPQEATESVRSTPQVCEACAESSAPLERAHWVPSSEGGPSSFENIILLCPNCHAKLDQLHDPSTVERVRAILLYRTAVRLVGAKGSTAEQFLITCRRIIEARR